MKKRWLLICIVILLLAVPYGVKLYGLKTITSADLPAEGAWAELSQGNLYYRWHLPSPDKDKGETLVLVHGFSTPHFVWDGVKGFFLDAGYKVLVYDHFGRGLSERPAVIYGKALYVESLRELLLDQQVTQPVHLLGYSMGGAIAGHFTQAYPGSIKTLTLIAPAGLMNENPTAGMWSIKPLIGEWFWQLFAETIVFGDVGDAEVADINDPLAISQAEFMERASSQMRYRGFVEALLSTVRNFNLFNAQDTFRKVGELDIPTLVMWGTDDTVVPYSGSENMAKAIPHAELVTIVDGGHNITYMQPSIVGPAVIDFVGQQHHK